MANISIVNYCNLKCPYCFANDMINNDNYTISLEELNKILDFCKKTGEFVGIIGGEPTLHPQFNEILNKFKEYKLFYMNRRVKIFSNGIELEPYLYSDNFYDYFELLININHPDCLTNEQYNKTVKTLDKLKEDNAFLKAAGLSCNFYPLRNDYDYIWDIIKKYDIKELRVSACAPGGQLKKFIGKKEEYYNIVKDIFIKQCELAKKNNIFLTLDCNNVPLCYYTNKELELIKSITMQAHRICDDPVVDIMFGKKISACFGAYDLIDHDLFDFNDMNEVRRYLKLNKVYPKIIKNGTGKCATCKQYELAQCQGGCLGFVS